MIPEVLKLNKDVVHSLWEKHTTDVVYIDMLTSTVTSESETLFALSRVTTWEQKEQFMKALRLGRPHNLLINVSTALALVAAERKNE